MNVRYTPQRLPAWISLIGLVLTGCASQHKALLPDSGPTTLDVYNQHAARPVSGAFPAADATANVSNIDGDENRWSATLQQARPESVWSRTTQQALASDFQRIPNPELTGYVFPHLTRQGHPVPGYSTRFYLYEQNAYALPGELPVPAPEPGATP